MTREELVDHLDKGALEAFCCEGWFSTVFDVHALTQEDPAQAHITTLMKRMYRRLGGAQELMRDVVD